MGFLPDSDFSYIIVIRKGSFSFGTFGLGWKWHQRTEEHYKLDGVGESKIEKNWRNCIINCNRKFFIYMHMRQVSRVAKGACLENSFARVRIPLSTLGVLFFFQILPIFKGLYLICAKFRDFRTFTMQFCILQRAFKPKLIHLLLPAQFQFLLCKFTQV